MEGAGHLQRRSPVHVFQMLLKQSEAEALHTKTLLKRAAEIQLSPQNRTLLGQQAHGLREQVEQVEARLKQE